MKPKKPTKLQYIILNHICKDVIINYNKIIECKLKEIENLKERIKYLTYEIEKYNFKEQYKMKGK